MSAARESKTKPHPDPKPLGFKRYLESAQFERDLDELGTRLGLTADALRHDGATHRSRVKHKVAVISKRAALDTFLGTAKASRATLPFFFARRFAPMLTAASFGASVARIGYHCYQVFLRRKQDGEIA